MIRSAIAVVIFVLFASLIVVDFQAAKAETQTKRPFFLSGLSIESPTNTIYNSNMLTLNVTSRALQGIDINTIISYSIDGSYQGIITTTTEIEPIISTITYANGTVTAGLSIFSPNVTRGDVVLPQLVEGVHSLTVYARYDYPNTNRFVTPYPGTLTYYQNSTMNFTITTSPNIIPTISCIQTLTPTLTITPSSALPITSSTLTVTLSPKSYLIQQPTLSPTLIPSPTPPSHSRVDKDFIDELIPIVIGLLALAVIVGIAVILRKKQKN